MPQPNLTIHRASTMGSASRADTFGAALKSHRGEGPGFAIMRLRLAAAIGRPVLKNRSFEAFAAELRRIILDSRIPASISDKEARFYFDRKKTLDEAIDEIIIQAGLRSHSKADCRSDSSQ
jgi:hypothetical protein